MRRLAIGIAVTSVIVSVSAAEAQDAAKGKEVFNTCMACHMLDQVLVGPPLKGVVGRKAGSVPGYNYSEVMKAATGDGSLTWSTDEIVKYLKNPTEYLQARAKSKGKASSGASNMTYMLDDEQQRKDVAAFLAEQK